MIQIPDMAIDHLKDVPGFKGLLKAVIKSQIQLLLEQLAKHTDEESIILSASITDGGFSHMGSETAKDFLSDKEEIKSQFLRHCLMANHKYQAGLQETDRAPSSVDMNVSHDLSHDLSHDAFFKTMRKAINTDSKHLYKVSRPDLDSTGDHSPVDKVFNTPDSSRRKRLKTTPPVKYHRPSPYDIPLSYDIYNTTSNEKTKKHVYDTSKSETGSHVYVPPNSHPNNHATNERKIENHSIEKSCKENTTAMKLKTIPVKIEIDLDEHGHLEDNFATSETTIQKKVINQASEVIANHERLKVSNLATEGFSNHERLKVLNQATEVIANHERLKVSNQATEVIANHERLKHFEGVFMDVPTSDCMDNGSGSSAVIDLSKSGTSTPNVFSEMDNSHNIFDSHLYANPPILTTDESQGFPGPFDSTIPHGYDLTDRIKLPKKRVYRKVECDICHKMIYVTNIKVHKFRHLQAQGSLQ